MTKYLTLMAFLALAFVSCDKDDIQAIECDGECLFVMEKTEGEIIRLNCFDSYAIKAQNGEDEIYGLPDQMNVDFEEEGMKVTFTAKFRANEREPFFPDPPFDLSYIYQIEVVEISK